MENLEKSRDFEFVSLVDALVLHAELFAKAFQH